MGQIKQTLIYSLNFLIIFYRCLISPILPTCCRFYPSCSQFAIQAIDEYGLLSGIYLTIARLIRCHPWSLGGYDPVLFNKEKD